MGKPGKSNPMKKLSLTLISLLALAGGGAKASQPLAFDFLVTGSDLIRPVLVFHDGENTYIQPPDNIPLNAITVKSAEAAQYGPYLMVKGVPKFFTLNMKKEQVNITYTGDTTASSAPIATAMLAASLGKAAAQAAPSLVPVKGVAIPAPAHRDAATVAQAPGCEKRVSRSESAYVVGFDFPPGALPSPSVSKLRLAVSPASNIESIFISLPQLAESAASARSKALDTALVDIGVPASKIHTDFKGKTDFGAEIRIVRSTLMACATETVRIEAPHSGAVTVLGTADAKQIVEELALKLGVMFRTEGDPVPLPVVIAETEVPLITVLQKIGNGLNQRAIVVSRPNELLIRYRTQP